MHINKELKKYLTNTKYSENGTEFKFMFNSIYGAIVIKHNDHYQIRILDKENKTYFEMIGYFTESETNNILNDIKNRRLKK